MDLAAGQAPALGPNAIDDGQAAVEAPAVSPQPGSVLIGFADALAAPEVAASLLGAGYAVVSFSRRGRTAPLRRLRGVEIVEVTAPEDDFDACVRRFARSRAAHRLTMPLDDQAVLVCDRALPADALVAGPRGAQARLALDKRLQLRSAGEAGLEVPAWTELDPEGDPARGVGAAG